jgi:hypothetical protein
MEKRITDVDCIPNEVRQIYNASCEEVGARTLDRAEQIST